MPRLQMEVAVEEFRLSAPFRISGYVFEEAPVAVVTLSDGSYRGRGEASGVYYTGDDIDHMLSVLETHREAIERGIDREELRALMPIGGARNAVDCALWELEASRAGRPVWELAGLSAVRPLVTTFTLGAEDPAVMASGAVNYAGAREMPPAPTRRSRLRCARRRSA